MVKWRSWRFFVGLLFKVIIGWLAIYIALKRGRNAWVWFALSFLFVFPIFILAMLPPINTKRSRPFSFWKETNKKEAFQGETLQVRPLGQDAGEISFSPLFESCKWYQLDTNRKSEGPFTFLDMRDRFWEGMLDGDSYIWTPSWKDWKKVSSIRGLLHALSMKSD